MEKLEKVIKGLECCIKINPDDRPRCGECPYEGACLNRLKHDALELLKAQEPRVMTLDEVQDWDGAVFFEAYETDMYYALIEDVEITAGMNGAYTFVNVEPGEHHRRVWDGNDYNIIWRCWTSRPTDEQREAVKWDG